jgi:hypothetical protein
VDERGERRGGQREGRDPARTLARSSRLQRLYMIACKGAEGAQAQGFVRIASCGQVHRVTCTGGIADTPRGGEREGLH